MVYPYRVVLPVLLLLLTFFCLPAHSAQIEFFSPSGDVKKVRQVVARFSEQMVALGDPHEADPFDISCSAPGKGRWADQRSWIYDFDADLPAGVSCTFTQKPGLTTLSGSPVASDGFYTFNTGGPSIIHSEPREGNYQIDENQAFILGLDAPATPESILQHAFCRVDGIQERIPVRLIVGKERKTIMDWRKDFLTSYFKAISLREPQGRLRIDIFGIEEKGSEREKFLKLRDGVNSPIVVLQCQRTLPNDTTVSLVWDAGITSASGVVTRSPQRLAFKSRPIFDAQFSCERVNKDADCIPVLPLQLNFSAPVSLGQVRKIRLITSTGKAIAPKLSKQAVKEGAAYHLNFPTPLPEKSIFKIVLPENLRDDGGRPLSNAARFPLSVRTDENPPIAKFAADFGILELNASPSSPPLLPVTLRNVERDLAGELAQSVASDDAPMSGNIVRGDSEMAAVEWLRRLNSAHADFEQIGRNSIFARNDKIKSFKLPKPLPSKTFEVVGIPLKDPGFYVVELQSLRLGEALLAEKRPYFAHAATLVTNLSVHFKQGRESSLVWVTSLDHGKPVANAEVAVRNCAGHVYARGRTDEQGLLRVEQELPEQNSLPGCTDKYDSQYFVTARAGRDFSFVFSNWGEGIAPWRFNIYQGGWEGHNLAHAVLDRTLLRSGETVHMKLFMRRKKGGGFGKPDAALPNSINIVHQASEETFTLPVKWDGQATAVLDWQIPQDAKQGLYQLRLPDIEVDVGGFMVSSFRVPLMRAIVQPSAAPLVNVSQAPLNIQVNYLSGGGATGLPVKLRGQLQPKAVVFADYDDFTFANGRIKPGVKEERSEPWSSGEYELSEPDADASASTENGTTQGRLLSTQSLRLDTAGAVHAVFAKLPKSDEPREILAELEYRDPNGETQTAASRIALWPSNVVVGVKPDGWMESADHLKFHALVLDLKGHPLAGVKIGVSALQREYFSHRRRLLGGFYAFDNHNEIKMLGEVCQGVSDEYGLLICDVKAPGAGNIILQAEAKDADGNASVANREIWVAGSKDWWFDASDNDRIDFLPEKKRYEPGDTARFQVRMPFKEATALVTVEREGVLESFTVPVSRSNPTIAVPIKGSYAPNVFVSALVVRGRISGAQPTAMVDLAKPAFKMGLAEVKVGWAAHELRVKVATDKQVYKVREKAAVSVDVRRADGALPPANSEITLVAVDEGLLELKPNHSWKLLDAMMKQRGIEVSTSTAQMQVIGKRHFGRKAVPAGGGGGAGKSARELLDTLLFWQARIKLDANGHAEAQIPLNDSLTSFRIVAVASGELDLFGTGSTSIQSAQDLMLLSGLPPVVREQDKFRAGFTVRNASDHPITADVNAKLSAVGEAKSGLAPITVSLGAGEAQDIGWEVTAPLDVSMLKWDVVVRAQGAAENGDSLKVSQKVIPVVPVRTLQASILQLEQADSVSIKKPEDAIPGRGGVKVTFRKRLGGGLPGVREYMSRYPYSCLEQQVSKAIALQDIKQWESLMKLLPTYLDRDDLIKYFPVMQEGDDTLTAYLLAVADEAGYPIPDSLRSRMRKGLTDFVEGRVIRYSALPTSDLSVRKLAAIAALSREGDVDKKWLDSISIEPNLWPTSAVLDWYTILKRSPQISAQAASLADNAEQIIRSRLNFQGSTMGFSTERNDTLWWLMINGDVNANRALLVMLEQVSWKTDVPRLVKGALGRQQEGRWSTTVANAWGVLAMKKFTAKFEAATVTGKPSARLGKDQFTAQWSDAENSAEKLLPWPPAAAPLKLSYEGAGKPWVSIQSLAALTLHKPLFTGYRVARQILPVERKDKNSWHKGDVVRIHLDVEAQSDMSWVVVNDPIPAGASILGTGLGGDSKIFTSGEKKQGWVRPAFEERTFDSFHAYYRFVPKGKFSVEYTVRLNNDGEFQLPPTRVEAMYAPEMFGELPNDKIAVEP